MGASSCAEGFLSPISPYVLMEMRLGSTPGEGGGLDDGGIGDEEEGFPAEGTEDLKNKWGFTPGVEDTLDVSHGRSQSHELDCPSRHECDVMVHECDAYTTARSLPAPSPLAAASCHDCPLPPCTIARSLLHHVNRNIAIIAPRIPTALVHRKSRSPHCPHHP